MNKLVNADELLDMGFTPTRSDFADQYLQVPVEPPKMTRREKLLHLASLVRQWKGTVLLIHGLEYIYPRDLDRWPVMTGCCSASCCMTPFAIAAGDPKFQKDSGDVIGLNSSLGHVMSYLEISQRQAHDFSCDCGGAINPHEMADRIERLA